MNSSTQEGSDALKDRTRWSSIISSEELEALKRAIAQAEDFPVDEDNAFLRTSEEWITLEEVLGTCFIAVFNHYKPEEWEREGQAIILVSPLITGDFQCWIRQDGETELILVNQNEGVRRDG